MLVPGRGDRVVDGPTPKHAQLREILRRAIEQDLPPGAALPSERELAERFGVSRLTVRSAIGKLAEEGLLDPIRGKGTFTVATADRAGPAPRQTGIGGKDGGIR